MEDFVKKHLELIEQERQEEVAQGLSLLSTDLKNITELETKGACLSKLGVESERIGLFGRHIVTFSHRLGRHKFPTHSITCGNTCSYGSICNRFIQVILWVSLARGRVCCQGNSYLEWL